MKKIYLLLSIIIGFALSNVQSQSIEFYYEDELVEDTLRLDVSEGDFRTDYVFFKNISEETRTVKVHLQRIEIAEDAELLMCFNGDCQLGDVTNTSIDLEPEVLFTEFDLQYIYSNSGLSIARVNVIDAETEEVLGSFIAKYRDFSYLTSIKAPSNEDRTLRVDVFPNPVTERATIKYNLPSQYNNGKIIIRNMVGNVVRSYDIRGSGKINLEVCNLANGVYFYSITSNGINLSTKKMIIKH